MKFNLVILVIPLFMALTITAKTKQIFKNKNRVRVDVSEGKLIGTIEKGGYGDRYFAFRGIPYAKPPVGELRFRDPMPPEPWCGDRDASKYGNIAVQFSYKTKEVKGDEDCLYLNVYTTNLKPLKKRPVFVWIHGGGYFSGDGDSTLLGPDHLVRKNVVVVTLNYRLGVLGFLNLKNEAAAGNQGLKDVVMALRWIQKNIIKFGGDPDNVTIAGQSAGASTVHYLAISPFAEGLFHKAISESGVVSDVWAFKDCTKEGFQLAEKLGKPTSDPKIASEFLKTIDARKLIETERQITTDVEIREVCLVFAPSLDSASPNPFFPEYALVQRGVTVPFLLGFTNNEGSFILSSSFYGNVSKETLEIVDRDFEKAIHPQILSTLPQIPVTVEKLRYFYFGDKPVTEETLTNYANFIGDQAFYRGIIEAADIQTNMSNSTYMYQFSYWSENSFYKKIFDMNLPGTAHMEELGYLFYPHIIKDLGSQLPAPGSRDYRMIEYLTQMWTDFAKTGNPTPAITDLISFKWTPLERGNVFNYLDIDIVPQMKILQKGQQRWDWENLNK